MISLTEMLNHQDFDVPLVLESCIEYHYEIMNKN